MVHQVEPDVLASLVLDLDNLVDLFSFPRQDFIATLFQQTAGYSLLQHHDEVQWKRLVLEQRLLSEAIEDSLQFWEQ